MRRLALIALMVHLAGCAYNIPSYQPLDENLSLLSSGARPVQVVQEEPEFDDDGSITCRFAGSVTLPDGESFSDYITTALKDELHSARLFSENAASKLHVTVKRVDFSSHLGDTNWYIDTDYVLDGRAIYVSSVYHDRSSYLAQKACNNMARYFRKAVAEHLRKLYMKPEFRAAIGFTEKSQPPSSDQNRFQQLRQLYEDGLITQEEYKQKRESLLNEL